MKNIILITILFSITLMGCKKEAELIPKNYPYVLTLTPEVTNDGVHLTADVLNIGSDTILGHGFQWSAGSYPSKIVSEIMLNQETKEGLYEYDVVGGLIKGNTYSVRAIIETKDYRVYGTSVSFVCTGTKAPVITSFSPKQGNIGTQVVINGSYFAPSLTGNLVQFGEAYAKIDSVSTNRLVVTVQENTKQEKVKITVETAKMKTTSTDYFSVIYPWFQKSPFDGVHPKATSFSVGNFGYVINPDDNQMLSYNVVVDSWQKNINLPENSGNNPLAIATYSKGYALLKTGFWEYNTVDKNWERKADFPGVVLKYAFGFSIDGNIYVGNCYENYEFWKYEVSTNTWERKADFVINPEIENIAFSHYYFVSHNQGFLGINSEKSFRKLWQYNATEDAWVNKAALLTYAYDKLCCFVINDEAYVGLGRNPSWVDSQYSNRIWKYDYLLNSWTEFHSCNDNLPSEVSFSINQKGYTINDNSVWEFDPEMN